MADLSLFTGNIGTLIGIYLACAAGIPVPEEITLISAGVLAATKQLTASTAAAAGLAGIVTSDWTLYFLGRHLGAKVFRLPVLRNVFTKSRVLWAETHIGRNGSLICFCGRFLPGLRVAIFAASGALGVKPQVFIGMELLAAITVVSLWVSLGNWMGSRFIDAVAYAQEIKITLVCMALV
ncbi:MAG: DedA family protein, partial [Smithellaceae bacterium]|nr:DedA family protein [Smithellaceae bacterium]